MTYILTRGIPVIAASLMVTSGVYAGHVEETTMMPNGCKGPTLCSNLPNIDSNGCELNVGLLCEQFRLTGNDVGYKVASGGTYNTTSNISTMEYPKWDLKCGVTVGFAYKLPHDDWSVGLRFDWLQGVGRSSTTALSGPVGVWQANSMTTASNPFSGMKDWFSISYYNLDIGIMNGFYPTGCFSFQPHIGIKTAWIQYKDHAIYGSSYNTYVNSKFWGFGPSCGIDTIWALPVGLSLTYNVNTALMFGYNEMDSRYIDSAGQRPYVTGNNQVFSPAIRNTFGIRYDADLDCCRQHVFVRLAWDTSVYFNQWNHIIVLNESVDTNYHTSFNNYFGMTGFIFDVGWNF